MSERRPVESPPPPPGGAGWSWKGLDWQHTFDAMADFVAVLDADSRFVRVNRAMAELLGQTPEALVGVACHEVMHGRSGGWPGCPHAEMLRTGRPVSAEVDDPHLGRPLLVTASPVFGRDGTLLGSFHVAKDVSAIRSTLADLKARNRELELLWDLTHRATGSPALEEVGREVLATVGEALGPDLAVLYTRQGEDLVLLASEPAEGAVLPERKRVGVCLCGLAASGAPVFSADIHCDARCTLDECKEAGLRSFAALPLVHQGEVIGVLGVGSREPRDFAADRRFLEILAGTVAVIVRNARFRDEQRRHAAGLEEAVGARTRDLEARSQELERSQRALTYLLEDVNEIRAELARSNEKLRELDRLKSMFIASMSHELRTPLNSIIGFAGVMLQGLAGPVNEEQKDQLGRVFRAGKHLLGLITDVIDISKIESGRVQPYAVDFDLAGLVEEAVETLRPQAIERGLSLEAALPAVPVTLHTDRKRLLQCLLNLVSNAVKFTETGGVTVTVALAGDGVELTVADTGIGIAPADQKLLFQSFVRLDSPLKVVTPGTGLGLYLTRKLAEEVLGGTVSAESREGSGSRFTLRVPRVLPAGDPNP